MEKCTGCGACSRACKMKVDVTKNINSAECIRCGQCVAACSENAIGRTKILSGNRGEKMGEEG